MIEAKNVMFKKNDIVIEGTTYLIPPNPQNGFNCGYSVFVPKNWKQTQIC